MDDRAYWIWLQQAFGPGSKKPYALFGGQKGAARAFHEGGPKLWNTRREIEDREASALYAFSLQEAEARLEYADKVGWDVITPECEKYPELLRNIFDPPAVLYVKGKLPEVDAMPSIAVAGSRAATKRSQEVARSIAYQLAAGGACVVSGGAVGVDAAALTGALSIPDSAVVSVLPVSLDSSYLTANAKLRASVYSHGGALVSEYFSLQKPEFGGFQQRNRLITGLSAGVLLIQAARKSGTMIYASRAVEQNRDLFVYPGPEDAGEEFAGSRALLADGAKAVTCGEDILAEYADRSWQRREVLDLLSGLFAPELEAAASLADPGAREGLSGEKARLLEALGGETLSLSQLEERTGQSAAALMGALTGLELDGFVISLPGKRYARAQ